MSNTTKINFSEVKIGDVIRITIEDCGIGTAVVLTKDKDFMTINIDRDTFTPCYDCQSLGSSLMDIHENEIHEIILINRKEETKMKKKNIHAEGYLRKEDIRKELETYGIKLSNTKFKETRREALLELLEDAKIKQKKEETTMAAKDYTKEIYKGVILQADTNIRHNFISDWMLTSIISEIVIGLPLKGKGKDGKIVEYYKSFTSEQRSLIAKERKAFIEKADLITVRDKGNKITGYLMTAKTVVYGRHKFLGKTCVFNYKNEIEYHVNLNGVKNTRTGIITPLTDEGYEKLDKLCTFVC